MATYLVLKRVKEDWVSLPGQLLVDPPSAAILMERGYIVPVPDNYPGEVSRAPAAELAEEEQTPSGVPATEAESAPTIEDLMKLNRAELNELAGEEGIEDPEGYDNKRQLAEAILEKATEESHEA